MIDDVSWCSISFPPLAIGPQEKKMNFTYVPVIMTQYPTCRLRGLSYLLFAFDRRLPYFFFWCFYATDLAASYSLWYTWHRASLGLVRDIPCLIYKTFPRLANETHDWMYNRQSYEVGRWLCHRAAERGDSFSFFFASHLSGALCVVEMCAPAG